MNPFISLGLVISIVGVTSDNLTTLHLPTDKSGKRFESNSFFERIYEKWGYKAWVCIEILLIIFFELTDLLIINQLFFSVLYGTFRGVAAIRNFKIIDDYQIYGINAFRRDKERRRQYLFCFVASVIVLFLVFLITFLSAVNLFLFLFIEGFSFGVSLAFFRIFQLTK